MSPGKNAQGGTLSMLESNILLKMDGAEYISRKGYLISDSIPGIPCKPSNSTPVELSVTGKILNLESQYE